MKKAIISILTLVILGATAIGGTLYYQHKDQIAQLEKLGMEFLDQELTAAVQDSVKNAIPTQGPLKSPEGIEPAKPSSTKKGGNAPSPEKEAGEAPPNPPSPEGATPAPQPSGQEMDKKVQEVTTADKLTAIKIVISKVPPGELNHLKEMAAGGVTPVEKKEALAILKSRLSPEDMEALLALARKYKG